ncbi:hypothetical protein ASPCADRAFT_49336 [Aspergillus carbonarius ITEM 5010]|uniref:Chromatin remodeling complex subunit n=1 Tax=Aspergillus carbonarius (strain ITEM 5010) TaxID=602072 RepID=A0A1R3RKT0_ASPC5|nr:hypothetical protein ASPCADRAFT_49084 [Aspergillus carbonarius ITEM 5010]OOF95157.1 hypothetical protein ASPCADRAFT_49336 [Aspergillus carbonarius ITEM 5010]
MDTGQATSGEGERPHSDNETDLVMELFAKFNNPTSRPEQPQQPKSEPLMVEIPVAAASYLSQYEFLPGHFDVRYVISEISEADAGLSYQVRLQSGETEMMSFAHLQSLQNGPEALSNFLNYGPDHYVSSRSLSGSSSEEQSSSSDSDAPNMRRSRRATRGRRSGFTAFFEAISSDDDKRRKRRRGTPSSDDIIVSAGATSTGRQALRRRTKNIRSVISESDEESDYSAPKGTRFSTRTRKAVRRSLRERNEDDISENEDTPRMQKFFGAKEVFRKIPEHDSFRQRHRTACEVCHIIGDDYTKGPLVFCQGCTSAYHQACLGPRSAREHLVTKVGEDLFLLQCRRCLGISHIKDPSNPHQGRCSICNIKGNMSKPIKERLTPKQEQQLRQQNGGKDPITPYDMSRINDVDNVLFRCTTCHRAFHFDHLSEITHMTWQCQCCSSAPGEVGAIVAWRPVDPKLDAAKGADKEYLIKWKNKSYNHTTWMPGSWVWGFVNHHMRRAFLRSDKSLEPRMTTEEAIPDDFLLVDIVFDVRFSGTSPNAGNKRSFEADAARVDDVAEMYVKFKGLPYEDVAWDTPPDRSNPERWESFKAAYEDWVKREYTHIPNPENLRRRIAHVRKQDFSSNVVKNGQPETMSGGEIMDYQKDGVDWLYYMWFKQQNAILADEMGLGKTIQVIGFFATLIQYHKCWPFLVVVPNSTCPNWRKEIKSWVPSMRVVTYYGSAFSRKLAQDYEMFADDDPNLRCHVVVASYETLVDDASRKVLSKVPWAGLIVDEGQRLKNDKSQLYDALSRIKFPFKILLTGTPLQNNIRELFNLLQFCDPSKRADDLENEYGNLSQENILELHHMIRPFFLRRTKAQVLTFLPPVAQIIVPVSMSVVQKKLYKSILAKNPQLIKAIFQRKEGKQTLKQTEKHNLNNILMQLRKCLCHPFVYSRAIEEKTANTAASHRHLVDAAGKFQLLELMLPKLKLRGHRVLIFSQFLENLDIIEDFLEGLGMLYLRLDGRMTSLEKQKTIEAYNAQDSPYFAFLLSTRSGGVGINLATADTVIIMDPDFNPHQDMQALSRAHRIGQKNKVLVFQLMTRGSAEEKIMQIGKKKMVLDHVLIDRMVSEEDDGRDLESILRHGAQALFDDDDSGDVRYDAESVDKLLDRSQAEQARTSDESSHESQFSFARVWANDNQNLEDQLQTVEEEPAPSADVWEKILREREQAAAEEARRKAETLGRGKRKRTAVDYANDALMELSPVKDRTDAQAESDVEFRADEAAGSESDSAPDLDPEEMEQVAKRSKGRRPCIRTKSLPPPMDGSAEPSPYQGPPCIACHQAHPVGHCRLKMAGVEHCPLCGLAHYGYSRTCPHLRSEAQVTRMLAALKQSTEAPEIVQLAKRYLGGIRSDLAQRKRRLANKATSSLPNHGTTTTSSTTSASAVVTNSPVVDLTMEDGPQPALQQPPLSAPLGPPRLLQPPPFENQPGHGV